MLRAAIAALAAAALVGCAGAPADVDRDADGRPSEAGDVRADRLRVGDCFDDQEDQAVSAFAVVPCDRPHDNEAFALFDVGDGRYPGQAALTDLATARCTGELFTRYVGHAYEGSSLDVFQVLPTVETWEGDGDRQVICALFAKGLVPLTGSVRGSRR